MICLIFPVTKSQTTGLRFFFQNEELKHESLPAVLKKTQTWQDPGGSSRSLMENKWAITALKKKPKRILICDPKYPRPRLSVWLKTPGCNCLSHTVLFIKKKKREILTGWFTVTCSNRGLQWAAEVVMWPTGAWVTLRLNLWHTSWSFTQLPARAEQRLWVRWYLVKREQMIATKGQKSRVDHAFPPRQFYNIPPFFLCLHESNYNFVFLLFFFSNCLWNVLTGCQSRPEDSPW